MLYTAQHTSGHCSALLGPDTALDDTGLLGSDTALDDTGLLGSDTALGDTGLLGSDTALDDTSGLLWYDTARTDAMPLAAPSTSPVKSIRTLLTDLAGEAALALALEGDMSAGLLAGG